MPLLEVEIVRLEAEGFADGGEWEQSQPQGRDNT